MGAFDAILIVCGVEHDWHSLAGNLQLLSNFEQSPDYFGGAPKSADDCRAIGALAGGGHAFDYELVSGRQNKLGTKENRKPRAAFEA